MTDTITQAVGAVVNSPAGAFVALTGISGTVFWLVEVVKSFMPDELEGEWIPVVAIGIGVGLSLSYAIPAHENILLALQNGFQYGANAIAAASGRGVARVVSTNMKKNGNGAGQAQLPPKPIDDGTLRG